MIGKLWDSLRGEVTGEVTSPIREARPEKFPTRLAKAEETPELKDFSPLDRERLEVELNIDLTSSIPDSWVILHIAKGRESYVKGYGFHQSTRHQISEFEHYGLDFFTKKSGEIDKAGQHPDVAIGRSIKQSRSTIPLELRDLLNNVARSGHKPPTIVIVEYVETRIPWELISVEGGYLGACCDVVRWTMLNSVSGHVKLNPTEHLRTGTAASFISPISSGETEGSKELRELQKMEHEAIGHRSGLLSLIKGEVDIGLIYLAGHGNFLYEEEDPYPHCRMGSRDNLDKTIYDHDLESHEQRRQDLPLVIANACYSGCMHKVRKKGGSVSKQDKRQKLHGFPEVFLSNAACAYIGALGSIENTDASDIGADIIRRIIEREEGVYPARLLREMRRDAALRVREAESSEKEKAEHLTELRRWMLHTFMYVYYGNPLLRLKIRRAEQD